MLRVSSNNVLVVPPFECAWLSGDEHLLCNGKGCISFEVKGDNDVTLIIKSTVGSRRWQHIQRPDAEDGQQVDPNYTIILGSHRNRCLKIEKNGILCCMADDVPGAKLTSGAFCAFWLDFNHGCITVGRGPPGANAFYRWTDTAPLLGMQYIGLSSWDKHVGYKNISVSPALNFDTLLAQQAATQRAPAVGVAPLSELATRAVAAQLSPENAASVLEVADRLSPSMDSLRDAALSYLATNCEAVVAAVRHSGSSSLPALPASCLQALLRHPELGCAERVVFAVLMQWYDGGMDGDEDAHMDCERSSSTGGCNAATNALQQLRAGRLQQVEELLPLVRFPLMTEQDLQVVMAHPVARKSSVLQALVAEAASARQQESSVPHTHLAAPISVQDKRLVRAVSLQEALATMRFTRRHPPSWHELLYISDGDNNGVCHHLGTAYGTTAWVNPIVAKRMNVRASSPLCRHTDPRLLVSSTWAHTNFAGPREEGGHLRSWWLLDLGPTHRLVCNYYTLRHDGSAAYARDWVLQGSLNGEDWVDLRMHRNDQTLKLAGQYGSWPVTGPAAAQPLRFFRVLMCGPSADAAAPHHLCCSNIELYGYFHKVPAA